MCRVRACVGPGARVEEALALGTRRVRECKELGGAKGWGLCTQEQARSCGAKQTDRNLEFDLVKFVFGSPLKTGNITAVGAVD